MITYAVKHGGRWHVIDVPPRVMIRFEDQFGQSVPDGLEGKAMWRHIAWVAHETLAPETAFEAWLDELEDLTGSDERIAAIRAELEPGPELPADPTPLRAASGGPE